MPLILELREPSPDMRPHIIAQLFQAIAIIPDIDGDRGRTPCVDVADPAEDFLQNAGEMQPLIVCHRVQPTDVLRI